MLGPIEKAIWDHSRWKTHLKQAIETGESDFNVTDTGNPHACTFGHWLDSEDGRTLADYDTIVGLHEEFHKEASTILALALQGSASEATARMQIGSKFNRSTAKLVNALAEIQS
jgi:hypothetical protein